MSDNVVLFPGTEEVDLEAVRDLYGPSVEVQDAMNAAMERGFNDVIIIGTYTDKENVYFASTSGNPAKVLWDLERAKHVLMDLFMNTENPLDYEE